MIKILRKTRNEKEIAEYRKIINNSWIYLEEPTEEEIEFVKNSIDIPDDFISACLDPEESPRFEKDEKAILVILKAPIQRNIKSRNEIETTTLGIIITDNHIITISSDRLDLLSELEKLKINVCTSKRTRLLLQIIFGLIQKFIRILKIIQRATEETERELFESIEAEDIVKIWEIRQSIVYLNDAIIGNGKVLESILKGRVVKLFKSDQELIEDLVIENNQLSRMISLMTELMAGTMDAYVSLISNNLNVVMKKLTSIALIFSVPTIISSIYGMNIPLPLQNNPHAFNIFMLVSLLVSIIIFIYFKKINWL